MSPVTDSVPLEIERKFLIAMPSGAYLGGAGATKWEIAQTYLTHAGEGSRRVRRTECGGNVTYTMTVKTRRTAMTCTEQERELTETEYQAALSEARPDSETVHKCRYRIPYAGHTLEIDVYPFWQDTAVLEVELQSEDEAFGLPPEIRVLREVTGEGLYKNTSIARFLHDHPGEPLPL